MTRRTLTRVQRNRRLALLAAMTVALIVLIVAVSQPSSPRIPHAEQSCITQLEWEAMRHPSDQHLYQALAQAGAVCTSLPLNELQAAEQQALKSGV